MTELNETEDSFDPFDMNKSEFNPNLYMYEQLRRCSLGQLLSKKNNVDKEIVEIKHNMQSLLYDNYNKFIRAMDMLSVMKKNFGKMEDQVGRLAGKMTDVGHQGTAILDNLQILKDRLSKLCDSKKSVKKLQILVSLVPSLQRFVNANHYGAAVRQYVKANAILVKYGDLPTFKKIKEECDAIMEQVAAKLLQKLDCEVYGDAELGETMNLLLQIEYKESCIVEAFLDNARTKLEQSLRALYTSDASSSLMKSEPQESYEMRFVSLSCDHLGLATKILNSFRSFSLGNSETRVAEEEFYWLSRMEDFVWTSTTQLFNVVRIHYEENAEKINDKALSLALDKFYSCCHAFFRLVPETHLCANNIEIVIEVCAGRCQYHLSRTKEKFDELLAKLHDMIASNPRNLNALLIELEMDFNELIKNALLEMLHYVQRKLRYSQNAKFRRVYSQLHVRDGFLTSFMLYVNDKTCEFCSTVKNVTATSLLLSKFFRMIHRSSTQQFLSIIREYFSTDDDFDPSSLSGECRATSELLIDHYVQVRQSGLSAMFRKGMESKDWKSATEPRKVRAVMKRIAEDLDATHAEIAQLFGEAEEKTGSDSGGPIRTTISLDSGSVLSSLRRLFADDAFEKPGFDLESILGCIFKTAFKSFLECVRLQVFNVFGLQQMQVDVHFLRLKFEMITRNEEAFHPLFDEVLSNCLMRTLPPYAMMDWTVVEIIVHDI